MHPTYGKGDNFKLLGTWIDVKLHMEAAVDAILATARPKVNALLRTRGLYDLSNMFMQYKTHVWGLAEYHNGCILHASWTTLSKLDRLQRHFVHELLLTEESAFIDYNFAPPSLRRQIGILGFIHKRVLGGCHIAIAQLLPWAQHHGIWHTKQIDCHNSQCICRHNLFNRSLFGVAQIYNRLPQQLVDIASVKHFQAALTNIAKRHCSLGHADWKSIFASSATVLNFVHLYLD